MPAVHSAQFLTRGLDAIAAWDAVGARGLRGGQEGFSPQ